MYELIQVQVLLPDSRVRSNKNKISLAMTGLEKCYKSPRLIYYFFIHCDLYKWEVRKGYDVVIISTTKDCK